MDSDKKIKIAFLSLFSPSDRKVSSGTNFKIAEQMAKIGELKWTPIKSKRSVQKLERGLKKLLSRFNKNIDLVHTDFGSKYEFILPDEKEFEDCDLIAAFFCNFAIPRLKTNKPIIYFSDATFPAMVDYYIKNLFKANIHQGIKQEREAMEKSSQIVLSSQWAAKSATEDLNIPKGKVNVIEYGANIDDDDIKTEGRKKPSENDLHMLFLGVDWIRKGGDIAVRATEWLNANGIKATLHIVGIRNLSDEIANRPYIENHGFLNKNIKEDYNTLTKIIDKCHIQLLPTKAECAGIAFAEAAAYGLPSFTHNTGGVCNFVIDGVNGYKLPLGSTGDDFGKKIKESLQSGEILAMSESARKLYEERLNWNKWGERVKEVIEMALK